jgi:hypothetical protein
VRTLVALSAAFVSIADWQAAEKVTDHAILRSSAISGTTKNLEILRFAQDDKVEVSSRSLS